MCLPRIGRIVTIDGVEAAVTLPGARTATVSLLCVPTATVGDHVMIHAGHAIGLLDQSEAVERQSMIDAITGNGGSATEPGAETPNEG